MPTKKLAAPQNRPVAPVFESAVTAFTGPVYQPLKVVAIGGGTGLSTLLRGFKPYVSPQLDHGPEHSESTEPTSGELTAVITVTHDGGCSGRLRKEFNMLPPGDIRNCLVALSEDEALLSRLFQYRFTGGSGLEGHSFGNLFLAALTAITKDFAQAVRLSSAILATVGRILPATTADVQLCAEMDDGSRVFGETSITASKRRIVHLQMVPPDAHPLPETLNAIAGADLITIGPGSLFTSLIPNLLVRGIPQAIRESPAIKVYVCNLMTQANESLERTAADHIRALNDHADCQLFDYALINRMPASSALKAKYALEGASQIVADLDAIEAIGACPVLGDYLYEDGVARHDTDGVAKDLMQLAMQAPAERVSSEARR